MQRDDVDRQLRDPESGAEAARTLVQGEHLPSEAWRWIIRHHPFGPWLSAVAATPSFPEDPVVVEHVLRHLQEGDARAAVLEAAVRRGSPAHCAEWWRELAAGAPDRAAALLVDLPRQGRRGLTQGDLDGARVWGRVASEEAAVLRAEAVAGPAGARLGRWRPVTIAPREVPGDLRTLGDVYAWATTEDQAEAVVTVLRRHDRIRYWGKDAMLRWPREMLTEAIVSELLIATTTAGRDLLREYPDDPVIGAWVLGWTLDAWRGKHPLVNHAVEKVATELVVDTLAQFTIPHGSRLWRDLVDVAARVRDWEMARAALYVVLTHPDVTNEDLDWVSVGRDWSYRDEWRETIARHPVRVIDTAPSS